jgi:MFS family permease
MDAGTARQPLLTRDFVLLAVADLAYFTCVGVAILALPVFVTGPIGSDEAGAGLAFGAFAITALLCRPFAGRYSDRLGRRPLMLLGAGLAAVGMVLMPHVGSLAAIVALRLVQGVGEAAFFVAGFAMLADLAPAERMGEALSYNSLGLYLGIAFGPPLGEVLIERGGFTAAWYGGGACAVVAGGLVLLLREPVRDGVDDGHGRLIHRPALPLTLAFLSSLLAVSGFLAFVALHAEDIGMRDTSLALFVYGCVVVVCRLVFARLPDRVPALPLAAASLAVMALGLVVIATWQRPAGLVSGAVVMAVGVTFVTPSFFAAIFATARPSERGAAAGTASASLDLGLGLGPILLGLVAGAYGIPWAFAVAALTALAGAAYTLHLTRRLPTPAATA